MSEPEDSGEPDDDLGPDPHDHGGDPADGLLGDPRVQAGMEHLQRAAHEVIAASRALLDVAEELVDDPGAARGIVDLFGSFATMARPGGRHGGPHGDPEDDDDDGEPPVQRIPVS